MAVTNTVAQARCDSQLPRFAEPCVRGTGAAEWCSKGTSKARKPGVTGMEGEVEHLVVESHGSGALDLSGRQLLTIPDSVLACASLTSLTLAANSITSLSTHISTLQALTALDLSYNQLTRIPEQIGSLSRLETLDVSYNHLTSIPDQASQLVCLRELRLNDNQLTHLPHTLTTLTNLTLLHIQYNKLTTLPAGLNTLPALEELNVEGMALRPPSSPPSSPPSQHMPEHAHASHTAAPSGQQQPGSSGSSTSTAASTSTRVGLSTHTGPSNGRRVDVLTLDTHTPHTTAQTDTQGHGFVRSPAGARLSPGAPAEEAAADGCLDLDLDTDLNEPGIDLVGWQPPGVVGGVAGGDGSVAGLEADVFGELPAACASVLYRTWMDVQTGTEEVRTGRPLSRAGTAAARAPPPPATAASRRSRPTTAGGMYRPSTALTQRHHPPLLATTTTATHSQASERPTASNTQEELTGVEALLARHRRPGTAAGGGGRPLTASVSAGPQLASVDARASTQDAAGAAMPAVTFPLASGLRGLVRQVSGQRGMSQAQAPGQSHATGAATSTNQHAAGALQANAHTQPSTLTKTQPTNTPLSRPPSDSTSSSTVGTTGPHRSDHTPHWLVSSRAHDNATGAHRKSAEHTCQNKVAPSASSGREGRGGGSNVVGSADSVSADRVRDESVSDERVREGSTSVTTVDPDPLSTVKALLASRSPALLESLNHALLLECESESEGQADTEEG